MTIQDEINSRTLKTVNKAQDFALDTIKTVSERVQPYLPKLDSLPYIDRLPTATEIVEKAFELQAELLKSAKKVAVEATKAFSLRDSKPASKSTKKVAPAATAATADAAS